MAMTQCSFPPIPVSPSGARAGSGLAVTNVTHRRPVPGLLLSVRTIPGFRLPMEPEDARLTGGTRSLERRLLALNLAGSLPSRAFAKPRLSPQWAAAAQPGSVPLGSVQSASARPGSVAA
jgi:hypothetical protein